MANNTYIRRGTILRHYGVPGMKWGLHRKKQSNGDLGLWYTGKRLAKNSPNPRGYQKGTSALLPAISPRATTSLSRGMKKRYSTIINSKTTAKGAAFLNKKLKMGLITVGSIAAAGAGVALAVKAIKKRRAKKVKDKDEKQQRN